MKIYSYIIVCLVFAPSCAPWKELLVAQGDQEDAIQNAIYDFVNSHKLSKEDSVFRISVVNYIEQIWAISKYGSTNKLLISTEDSVRYNYSSLAIKYKEVDGNLFYWNDSAKKVTPEILSTLSKYNMIDTTILNVYIPPRNIDHSKKGVDYYFCRDNLLKYKKVKTNQAMGYYDPPTLNCN